MAFFTALAVEYLPPFPFPDSVRGIIDQTPPSLSTFLGTKAWHKININRKRKADAGLAYFFRNHVTHYFYPGMEILAIGAKPYLRRLSDVIFIDEYADFSRWISRERN